MSRKKELRQSSKSELIVTIISLEERLEKIEHYLKAFDNAHTPSSKQLKKNNKDKDDESDEEKHRFPGKPKGGNGGGIKLPEPDKIEEHTLDVSPISGLPLGKPISYRIKTVIDFPDKPIQTIEHRFMQYEDPLTGEIIEAKCDLPNNIYGKNYKALLLC